MERKKLDISEIETRIKDLSTDWKYDGKVLKKEYKFPDFIKAFSFLTEVAIHSQSIDHHPQIINVYNRVEIELWTHDVDGITEYDFYLAKKFG